MHTQGIESQRSKLKRDVRSRVGRLSSTACEDDLVEWVVVLMIRTVTPTMLLLCLMICKAAFTFMCAPDPEPDRYINMILHFLTNKSYPNNAITVRSFTIGQDYNKARIAIREYYNWARICTGMF